MGYVGPMSLLIIHGMLVPYLHWDMNTYTLGTLMGTNQECV